MRHFSREVWSLFILNKLSKSEKDIMEAHLQHCDRCLKTYLSTLLPEDEFEAGNLISASFFDETMKLVRQEALMKKRNAKRKESGLLQYYAVAAAITVILMTGGWFELFVEKVPETIGRGMQIVPKVEERISFGWSDKVINEISVKLDAITGEREDVARGKK